MKTVVVVLLMCVAVNAGAEETERMSANPMGKVLIVENVDQVPYAIDLPAVMLCDEKGVCTHIGPEIKALLERARSLIWHLEACQNVPNRIGQQWEPGASIPNRSCEKESVKAEIEHANKDIEAMIERLK